MFCALLGHTGERLQDHWSSGSYCFSLANIKWSKIPTPSVLFYFNAKLFACMPVDGCSVIYERIKVFNPLLISAHTMQLAMLSQKADPFAHGSANLHKVAFLMLLILQG